MSAICFARPGAIWETPARRSAFLVDLMRWFSRGLWPAICSVTCPLVPRAASLGSTPSV